MLSKIISTFLLILLLTALQCKNNPVTPEKRSPRDYTWVRDTIGDGSYQSILSGLWGSSPSDVYAVGHSSDIYTRSIWHFNGSVWTDISMKYVEEAFYPNPVWDFKPRDVYGFSTNDVWIVGGRDTTSGSSDEELGFIMHFDGSGWKGTWLADAPAHTKIWGSAPNDVWVGGWNGQMFHFDGAGWSEHTLPDSIIVHHIEGFSGNEVYASGIWFPGGMLQIRYYRWDGNAWTLEESRYLNDPEPGFQSVFTLFNGSLMSNTGSTVSRRISKGNWTTIFEAPEVSFAWTESFSSTHAVAFGMDADGRELVYHFNGINWKRIESVMNPAGNVTRAWSDGEQMFLRSVDYSGTTTWPLSFVIRGK